MKYKVGQYVFIKKNKTGDSFIVGAWEAYNNNANMIVQVVSSPVEDYKIKYLCDVFNHRDGKILSNIGDRYKSHPQYLHFDRKYYEIPAMSIVMPTTKPKCSKC